jgi:hypothetical protein
MILKTVRASDRHATCIPGSGRVVCTTSTPSTGLNLALPDAATVHIGTAHPAGAAVRRMGP